MLLSAQFEGAPMPKKKPETGGTPISLPELRQRIDSVDRQIQDLIAERAGYARQVGVAKGPLKQAIDYYRPEREAQVLRAVADRNTGPLSNEELLRVFREIMSACLAQQNPLKIAYLGPEGTFSQAAVQKHFGHSVIAIPMSSIEEVFGEVENGNADFGVVPVENSTEGAVHHTFDMFLTTPLKICGEIELRVHQNLLSRATDMSQIERVYSHAQSLAQCRSWLRRNLPKAEKIAVSSNAEAARRARNAEDAAAIAGLAAAQVYGLKVLAPNIEDRPDNTTRFMVLGRELFPPSGHDKTSLLLAIKDQPGALYQLLTPLAKHGVSMTRIESRPARGAKWEYVFFIDVEGHIEGGPLQAALADLGPVAGQLKILGAYPAAIV
jgi:chorismate mutase/prephenate dehydratase